MKKHSHLKVIGIAAIFFMLLTWIIPAATFSDSFVDQGRVRMGIFDLLNYPIGSIYNFGSIILFILAIGGLYGVLHKTGAYRKILDRLADKAKGKENIIIAVITVLLAVITSLMGVSFELVIFFPMIIALVLLMGYDKITAGMVTIGSVLVGFMGTTLARPAANTLNSMLDIKLHTELIAKIALLVIGLVILIAFTLHHASKVKGKTKKEELGTLVPEEVKEEKGKKIKIWPIIVILDIIFLLVILMVPDWNESFNVNIFTKAHTAVIEFKIGNFAIFGNILGSISTPGQWGAQDFVMILSLGTFIIGLFYRMKLSDFFTAFGKGVKKALKPAFIALLVLAFVFIGYYNGFQLTIEKWLLGLTKGFNIVTSGIVMILASVFNGDFSFATQFSMPYMISMVSDASLHPLLGIMFQSIYAVVMLVAPTSLIMMVSTSYLDIPYHKWIKAIWKIALALFVLAFIVFTVLFIF